MTLSYYSDQVFFLLFFILFSLLYLDLGSWILDLGYWLLIPPRAGANKNPASICGILDFWRDGFLALT
jgi:hypothetical protein